MSWVGAAIFLNGKRLCGTPALHCCNTVSKIFIQIGENSSAKETPKTSYMNFE